MKQFCVLVVKRGGSYPCVKIAWTNQKYYSPRFEKVIMSQKLKRPKHPPADTWTETRCMVCRQGRTILP